MTTQSNRVADAITAAQTARQDRQPPPALDAEVCREIYHELGSRTTLRMINVLAHLFDHTPQAIAKILIQHNVRLRKRDLEILNTRAATKDQRTTARSNTSSKRSKSGKRQTPKDQKQSKNTVTSQKKRAGKILHAPRYPDPMADPAELSQDYGTDRKENSSPKPAPGRGRWPSDRQPRLCSVDGCTRKYYANNYCEMHRHRVKRHGTPGPVGKINESRTSPSCSVDGCTRKYYAKDYCGLHYDRVRRNGHPGSLEARDEIPPQNDYIGVHARLRRAQGDATALTCCNCANPADEWSYDHNDPNELIDKPTRRPYSVDPTHYVPRCRPCHRREDWQHRRPIDVAKCVALYRQGHSAAAIARAMGHPAPRVRTALRREGVTIRPGAPPRKSAC